MFPLQPSHSQQHLTSSDLSRAYTFQKARIHRQLRSLGVSSWMLLTPECRYLPRIIHPDEYIEGVIYGRTKDGLALLLATDRPTIFLNKKPFFLNEDEIAYTVVSGVRLYQFGIWTTVTLHTRIRDYVVQTLNEHCARGFVQAIETRCVENPGWMWPTRPAIGN